MMNRVKVMKVFAVKLIWVGYLINNNKRVGAVFMQGKYNQNRNSRIYYRLRIRKKKCLKLIDSWSKWSRLGKEARLWRKNRFLLEIINI